MHLVVTSWLLGVLRILRIYNDATFLHSRKFLWPKKYLHQESPSHLARAIHIWKHIHVYTENYLVSYCNSLSHSKGDQEHLRLFNFKKGPYQIINLFTFIAISFEQVYKDQCFFWLLHFPFQCQVKIIQILFNSNWVNAKHSTVQRL